MQYSNNMTLHGIVNVGAFNFNSGSNPYYNPAYGWKKQAAGNFDYNWQASPGYNTAMRIGMKLNPIYLAGKMKW